MKCPVCGAPMKDDTCEYCGYADRTVSPTPVNTNQDSTQEQNAQVQQVVVNNTILNNTGIIPGISRRSKMVALLLCIFLGGLGAHRFYVGKIGTGIIYLFTVGFFGIGWIIDIVLIATGSFKDEFGLPLSQ